MNFLYGFAMFWVADTLTETIWCWSCTGLILIYDVMHYLKIKRNYAIEGTPSFGGLATGLQFKTACIIKRDRQGAFPF